MYLFVITLKFVVLHEQLVMLVLIRCITCANGSYEVRHFPYLLLLYIIVIITVVVIILW